MASGYIIIRSTCGLSYHSGILECLWVLCLLMYFVSLAVVVGFFPLPLSA